MQPILCSTARIAAFAASNPLDLADETNLWLASEGESLEIIDWSYRLRTDSILDKTKGYIHSIVFLCLKTGKESQ
jgi:hypothetical protein